MFHVFFLKLLLALSQTEFSIFIVFWFSFLVRSCLCCVHVSVSVLASFSLSVRVFHFPSYFSCPSACVKFCPAVTSALQCPTALVCVLASVDTHTWWINDSSLVYHSLHSGASLASSQFYSLKHLSSRTAVGSGLQTKFTAWRWNICHAISTRGVE